MPYSKFNTKYQLPFSVIAVAPANPFGELIIVVFCKRLWYNLCKMSINLCLTPPLLVEEVVDNMIKRQEYLPGYIKRVEDKEGVAEFLQEADQLLKYVTLRAPRLGTQFWAAEVLK